ncbi:MAG: hypothetical protein LUE29_10315 [Lachnospiraceae bacterium]|nr:hypothetical protein [Lachnospiraceae bacterium]
MMLAMAGFDHTTFSLEEREQLALTKKEIKEMLSSISGRPDVEGCVYVSTCGRGELYLFCGDSVNAAGLLAENLAAGKFEKVFRTRTGHDVADHLFHTACGMRSQIYGEDQILAQLKQSLELAREAQAVSGVLDRMFLSAIAAGKKVKSTVRLTAVPVSVADRMLELLSGQTQIAGKHCLVIGNGEIGRLCAAKLLEAGAKVTVTVRNYRTREVVIPVGCGIVDYRERFRVIPETEVLVSATTSPHFTLPYPNRTGSGQKPQDEADAFGAEEGEHENPLLDGRERWLFDLALPRDIAPEYGKVPGIHLYGLDEVSTGQADRQTAQTARAEEILKTEEENFFRWMDFRRANRQAMHVGKFAAEDVTGRVHRRVKKVLEEAGRSGRETEKGVCRHTGAADTADIGKAACQNGATCAGAGETARRIETIYADAVKKVVDNLMYDLRDRIPEEQYGTVVSAMEQSVFARASAGSGGENAVLPERRTDTGRRKNICEAEEVLKVREETESTETFDFFPLFLDAREKTVLICGAGKVALRRVKKLLDFACGIRVIAPDAEDGLLSLAEQYPRRICFERKSFAAEELIRLLDGQPILFVVAATDQREVNREIGTICRARGVPVSVADRQEESSCYFPGIAVGTTGAEGTRIVAGISSEGTDHRRTAQAVKKIAELFEEEGPEKI